MTCPCDQPSTPAALDIAPGLADLPRQRWSFVELRAAMLDRARWQAALAEWRARAPDDYGVMWLEMMAYVGELVSLYDKAIADESYVRTAKLRPSLRRLLGVLGYVPRPAVAAEVELALIADGAQPVTLPVGTAFRSGAFAGQPPQVFELLAPTTIHPALDKWPVVTPASPTLTGLVTTLLVDPASARVAVGDVVLVELSAAAADAHVRAVTAVKRVVDRVGRRVVEVSLDRAVDAGAGRPVSGVRLRKATRSASLKSPSMVGGDLPSFGAAPQTYFYLDGVYREARAAERCLATYQGETRWLTITARSDLQLTLVPASSTSDLAIAMDGGSVTVPGETLAVPVQTITVAPPPVAFTPAAVPVAARTIAVPKAKITVGVAPLDVTTELPGVTYSVPLPPPTPPVTLTIPGSVELPPTTVPVPLQSVPVPALTVPVPVPPIHVADRVYPVPLQTSVVPGQDLPAITSLHTVITTADDLDGADRKASPGSATWAGSAAPDGFTIGLGLASAGTVLGASLRWLEPTDPLDLIGARAPVNSTPTTSRVAFKDAEQRTAAVSAGVDLEAGAIALVADESWSPGLATPVTAYGNVVTAVRGETVASEVLGSGDAAATMQRWKLAKAPLSYQAVAGAGDSAGVAANLRVWVDGLAWAEVPSFYGQGPEAQVYVVRQDDRGDSWVTFGDGVRGARLPSGAGNVVASYRFGAGAASPPAGSVNQLARPVPGLASVGAALAPGGGADAEPAESLRELAPRSALLLGRAISIEDMEVAARLAPGVSAARADWAWDGVRQRPVVKVWILGGPGVRVAVEERLIALTEPDTPIAVADATPVPATLAIDLEIDPRQVVPTVLATVTATLFGDDGWLTPPVLGIDRPLLRSRLLADLLSIPGVTGVRALTWNGAALLDYGVAPGPGAYFDLAATAAVTGS
ncbi:MAG: hypothetical protein IPH44_32530 [Myxococcales bacterium]|nr:hypothetical protein [Myxococcales bacterium]